MSRELWEPPLFDAARERARRWSLWARLFVLLSFVGFGAISSRVVHGQAESEDTTTPKTTTHTDGDEKTESTEGTKDDEPKDPASPTFKDPRDRPTPSGKQRIEISLVEAVRIALARNFSVRIAEVDHRIAERDLVVQRAVFDPFLTLGTTYSKNRRPTASFLDLGGGAVIPEVQVNPFESTNYTASIGGRTVLGTSYTIAFNQGGFDRPLASSLFGLNPQESTGARLQFTQPLVRGAWYPYNSASLRIAANNERAAHDDLEIAIADMIFQVESAYWSLVVAWHNLDSRSDSLDLAKEDLEKARKEFDAGTKARIYVKGIESSHALRTVEFDEAGVSVESARDTLLSLLQHGGDSRKELWEGRGRGPDARRGRGGPFDEIVVVPTTLIELEEFAPERDVSLSMAFENRADYRKFDSQLDSQNIRVELADNELWPQVDLTGTWEQLGLDDSIDGAFSSLGTGQFYGWSAGLQVTIPLSNRGPKANFRNAQDAYRQLRWQKMQLENQIVLEVDQGLRDLRSRFSKVGHLRNVVRLENEELIAERKRLAAGTSIPFRVQTIENDLSAQQASLVSALVDFLTARADYYRITGLILERYDVELDQ